MNIDFTPVIVFMCIGLLFSGAVAGGCLGAIIFGLPAMFFHIDFPFLSSVGLGAIIGLGGVAYRLGAEQVSP